MEEQQQPQPHQKKPHKQTAKRNPLEPNLGNLARSVQTYPPNLQN